MVLPIGHTRRRESSDNSALLTQLEELKKELASVKEEYKSDMEKIALDIVTVDSKRQPPAE
jgi:hypothetical protein|tara:strand:- start:594 stop:776 length:183 start_codon:yes stop_codon:yes gene_type:complete